MAKMTVTESEFVVAPGSVRGSYRRATVSTDAKPTWPVGLLSTFGQLVIVLVELLR